MIIKNSLQMGLWSEIKRIKYVRVFIYSFNHIDENIADHP